MTRPEIDDAIRAAAFAFLAEQAVEVRRDVLDEVDGPMLIHGLQHFQGTRLVVPRRPQLRPNVEFLEERYERFREAG